MREGSALILTMTPHRQGHQPAVSEKRFKRDRAVAIIIDACKMGHGRIDLNVWDGEATDIRTEHSFLPDAEPGPVPKHYEIVEAPKVRSAARILCDVYEVKCATFVMQVQGGRLARIQVGDGQRQRILTET